MVSQISCNLYLKNLQPHNKYANYILRGDSGFAPPELYNLCEKYGIPYVIRMKARKNMKALATEAEMELTEKTRENKIDYAVSYCEFQYQAISWDKPRRVVCKIEKPQDSFAFQYTFIVTTMLESATPKMVIDFYCKRDQMENFIKESKNEFDFCSTSSHSEVVNANRLQIHGLAYNLANWMRILILPDPMKKNHMDSIRLNLVKTASSASQKENTMQTLYFLSLSERIL